jgi:hypothetical protein
VASGEGKGRGGSLDEEAPPEGTPPGAATAVQDALRKVLLTGMGALFLTEEGARKLAREWKLPKDVIGYIGNQASGAKDEVLRIFSDEVRRFFESEAVRREFVKALSSVVVEVKAEIRVRPNEAGELEPEVKADVRARGADRTKKGEP